ncbi:MAG: hypothetical protein ACLVKA_09185 [Collinsella aerofaciens]
MTDVDTLKVFHACSQDMEVFPTRSAPCLRRSSIRRWRCLGERAQCSYHNLVSTFCGVSLPKTESLTDWSRRPLSPKQISTPDDDVRYLIDAYRVIESKLHSLGRTAWVRDEIRPLLTPPTSQRSTRPFKREARERLHAPSVAVAREPPLARQRAETRDIRASGSCPTKFCWRCANAPADRRDRAVRGTEQLSARDVEVALDAIARGRRWQENLPSIGRPSRAGA